MRNVEIRRSLFLLIDGAGRQKNRTRWSQWLQQVHTHEMVSHYPNSISALWYLEQCNPLHASSKTHIKRTRCALYLFFRRYFKIHRYILPPRILISIWCEEEMRKYEARASDHYSRGMALSNTQLATNLESSQNETISEPEIFIARTLRHYGGPPMVYRSHWEQRYCTTIDVIGVSTVNRKTYELDWIEVNFAQDLSSTITYLCILFPKFS